MIQNFGTPFFLVSLALAVIVIYKHRANLARAMAGTEPKLGEAKPISESPADEESADS